MPLVGTELARIKREYEEAYRAANGYDAPPLWYERGWWCLKIGPYGFMQRYRTARIVEMTATLVRRSTESSAPPATR